MLRFFMFDELILLKKAPLSGLSGASCLCHAGYKGGRSNMIYTPGKGNTIS